MEDSKETLKMRFIGMSPVLGFDLTDKAFETNTHLKRDWRTYVPQSIVDIWGELNSYERHVVALTAHHQVHPFDK